jgi:hypothetical protein
VVLGAAVGAALGAFVGFLFTARGRHLRDRLEPHVGHLARQGGLLAAEPLRRAVLGPWAPVADLLLRAGADDRASSDGSDSNVH